MKAVMESSDGNVGTSIPRVDGDAKVSGTARYVDDISLPGMLFGRTVRSTVPHARLSGIHLDPGFTWDGLTVVTADDIPGTNIIKLLDNDQPALVPVGGRIRHAEEPVALIAGADEARVAEALRHVHLEVEELAAVFDPEAALAGEIKVHGEDNVLARLEIHKGDAEAAIATAARVIEGTYRTGAQEQMYIETQGVIADWRRDEAGAPRAHVEGSLQCPFFVHTALKELLALDDDHVVVGQTVTGGAFGGKEDYPSLLAAHAVLLAKKAGAPVKMVYSRSEDLAVTTKRHPSIIHHRLGLHADGTIAAIDIDLILDGGAYPTMSSVVLARSILHAAGPYRCEHTRVIARAVATNTPPHGAFRGFGAPQSTFAYERQMTKAARALGLDPFAFRRLNMLRLGDTTSTGQKLESSVGSAEVLEAVEAQLAKPAPAPPLLPIGAPIKRGRGLAFYNHGAGFTGRGEERIKGTSAVAVASDGHFEVRVAATDMGQGSNTTLAQIAASALGVPFGAVRMVRPETDKVPNSGPTVASRTCMVVGAVVEKAAKQLRERLAAFGDEKGLGRDMIAVGRRYAEEHGSVEERATYRSPPGISFDDTTYRGDAYPCFGWAAIVVDVAVDTDTYEVFVERAIHAVDVGKAINPVIVAGQIEGGTLQALGWALWEHQVYQNGRVLNHRMTDNIIPTARDAPDLETLIIEVPYPYGPHGAKGLGELPMDGPAAAAAAALEEALADELGGTHLDEIPLLPEILASLTNGKPGGSWL